MSKNCASCERGSQRSQRKHASNEYRVSPDSWQRLRPPDEAPKFGRKKGVVVKKGAGEPTETLAAITDRDGSKGTELRNIADTISKAGGGAMAPQVTHHLCLQSSKDRI